MANSERHENSVETQEKVLSDKMAYAERRRQLIAEWKHVQQPNSVKDSNCLIVSLLNCVDSDGERNVLLGHNKGDNVEYSSGAAYRVYHQWCDQRQAENMEALSELPAKPEATEGKGKSVVDKEEIEKWEKLVSDREAEVERIENERYTSEGIYAWLEHLKGLGKISRFVWKRAHNLDNGFSEWFSTRMQTKGVGKRYIIFGYRGTGQGKADFENRLIGLEARKRGREEEESPQEVPKKKRPRQGNSVVNSYKGNKRKGPVQILKSQKQKLFQKLIDQWSVRKVGPPPVDVLMGADDVALSIQARALTIGEEAVEKGVTVKEWRRATGRSSQSYQDEEQYHKKCLKFEANERLRASMYARDQTQGNDGEVAEKSPYVWSQPLVASEDTPEEKRAMELHAERMTSLSASMAGGIVTRHGVAARVVEGGGDIVLMDPALRQVHVMGRGDVYKSCEEFFCCAVHYWAVYEVDIEVRL